MSDNRTLAEREQDDESDWAPSRAQSINGWWRCVGGTDEPGTGVWTELPELASREGNEVDQTEERDMTKTITPTHDEITTLGPEPIDPIALLANREERLRIRASALEGSTRATREDLDTLTKKRDGDHAEAVQLAKRVQAIEVGLEQSDFMRTIDADTAAHFEKPYREIYEKSGAPLGLTSDDLIAYVGAMRATNEAMTADLAETIETLNAANRTARAYREAGEQRALELVRANEKLAKLEGEQCTRIGSFKDALEAANGKLLDAKATIDDLEGRLRAVRSEVAVLRGNDEKRASAYRVIVGERDEYKQRLEAARHMIDRDPDSQALYEVSQSIATLADVLPQLGRSLDVESLCKRFGIPLKVKP